MYPYFNSSLLRVTGLEGAKAYPLQPNSMVALFDTNEDVFYIKQTDSGGFPTLSAYKFTPVTPKAEIEASSALQGYVTKDDLEKFKEDIYAKLNISESESE